MEPLRKIDCVMIRVPELAAAESFYAGTFGLQTGWRECDAIGMMFPETDAEIVLHTNPDIPSRIAVHYVVDDVVGAVSDYAAKGCRIIAAPFDIRIGKCAVIEDIFGTPLCILDLSKKSP